MTTTSEVWRYFQSHPKLDICYSTSDGRIFEGHDTAAQHVDDPEGPMMDKGIVVWHRSLGVIAESFDLLDKIDEYVDRGNQSLGAAVNKFNAEVVLSPEYEDPEPVQFAIWLSKNNKFKAHGRAAYTKLYS
jgi:hypothetical protein